LALERIRPPPPAHSGATRSTRPEKLQRILHGETPPLFHDSDGFSETAVQKKVGSRSRLQSLGPLVRVDCGTYYGTLRCSIPGFDGVMLSQEWKEALWDKFVMAAPRPRTPSELQYSDRRLRSRS
jgi:hypothetical protein